MIDISQLAAQVLISLLPLLPGSDVVPPRAVAVEPAVLQDWACGRPCGVRAWYSPTGTVVVDNRLDLSNDLRARSILVHELVHHVQRMREGVRARNCEDWQKREADAYRIQATWLHEHGIPAGDMVRQVRLLRCGFARPPPS